MKIRTLLGAAAVMALAVSMAVPAQAKEWKKVVIATEGAFAPYNLTRPDGKLDGFEIELGNYLCAHMKVTCEFVTVDWNSIIPGLQAGKFDAIMDGMSITPKRLEVIDFSRPYADSPSTFAVMKDSPLANLPMTGQRVSLDDKAATEAMVKALTPALKGKTVGVQVSTIQAAVLDSFFKGVMDVRTYGKTEEHDLDLQDGRLDIEMASSNYFVSVLGKPGGDKITLTGPLMNGGPLGQGSAVGLRKSDPELKAMFDDALRAAKTDGTLKTLALKWFHNDVVPTSWN